jgi:hypothetical protein
MGSTARLILPRAEPTAETALKPAPLLPAAPSLPYEIEQPWYGQRRAFRIIVLLLLLNIIAVTSITWGPITVRAWQEHRTRAQAAEAQAKADAARAAAAKSAVVARTTAVKACLSIQMPPGQVVYTEDTEEASRLLFAPAGGYSAISQSLRLPNVSPPTPPVVAIASPELRAALQAFVPSPSDGSLFLHERRTPAGTSRIIWVCLRASRQMSQSSVDVEFWMDRELRAMVLDPTVPAGGGFIPSVWDGMVNIEQAESRRMRIAIPSGGSAQAPTTVRSGEVFRVLTGRADPNDPARLLIDYTLDGKLGTIAMTLQNDGRLRFEPDRGATTIERYDARSGRVVWRP